MYHALAHCRRRSCCCAPAAINGIASRRLVVSCSGIVLFSGSLYVLVLTGKTKWGRLRRSAACCSCRLGGLGELPRWRVMRRDAIGGSSSMGCDPRVRHPFSPNALTPDPYRTDPMHHADLRRPSRHGLERVRMEPQPDAARSRRSASSRSSSTEIVPGECTRLVAGAATRQGRRRSSRRCCRGCIARTSS